MKSIISFSRLTKLVLGLAALAFLLAGCSGSSSSSSGSSGPVTGVATPSKVSVVTTN